MTPATAPAAYQFTHDPLAIGRNVLEYFDRAATLSAAVLLVVAGAALAGAALLASLWQRTTPAGRNRMLGAAVLVAVATVPLHWSRNARWVAPAELSAHVLDAIAPVVAVLPPDGVLISVPVAP